MLYLKTESGRHEVQARTQPLAPAQRQVLILCDGERYYEDLLEMMPGASLDAALEHLCALGLLQAKDIARPVKEEAAPLDEADRFRVMVELATSMAIDLGFIARVQAQLAIERARNAQDLSGVVDLLYKHLADQGKRTPLLALRLNKLRQLAQMQPAAA